MMSRAVWEAVLRKYAVPYRNKNRHLGTPTLIPHKDGESLLNKQYPRFLSMAGELVPDMNIDVYTHGLELPLLKFNFLDFLGSLPNKVRLVVSFHFTNHDGSKNDYGFLSGWLKKKLPQKPANVDVVFRSHIRNGQEWKNSWRAEIKAGLVAVRSDVPVGSWAGLMKDVATCFPRGCYCSQFGTIFVGATGNVVSCSLDLEEEIVHGNVLEDDPEVVMGRLETFYAAREKGKGNPPLCADCYGGTRKELIQIGGAR